MKIFVKNTVLKFCFFFILLTLFNPVDVSGTNTTSGQANMSFNENDKTCIKEYQLCRPGDTCCSGLNCSYDQCLKPCMERMPCNNGSDCCQGSVCDENYCARLCYYPGHDCVEYKDLCCSGICDKGKCVHLPKCGLEGQKCDPIHAPCCANTGFECINGICNGQCKGNKEKCDRTGKSFFDLCCDYSFCNINSKCQQCVTYGQKCKNDNECCFNDLRNKPRNCIQGLCRRPCFPNGNKCSENSDCCSDKCNDKGVCSELCSLEDHKCKANSDCCNPKQVCGEYNLCQKSGKCGKVGSKCSEHDDCCLSFCINGACKLPCILIGKLCVSNEECCDGGFCVRGVCHKNPCLEQGSCCTDDKDCCSNLCKNGKCEYICVPNGKQCKSGSMCCDKFCQNGTCCLAGGEACNFDYECCDKNCATGECKYKCSPENGTCSTSADCCFSGLCVHGRCGKNCNLGGYTCEKHEECCSGQCEKGSCCKQ